MPEHRIPGVALPTVIKCTHHPSPERKIKAALQSRASHEFEARKTLPPSENSAFRNNREERQAALARSAASNCKRRIQKVAFLNCQSSIPWSWILYLLFSKCHAHLGPRSAPACLPSKEDFLLIAIQHRRRGRFPWRQLSTPARVSTYSSLLTASREGWVPLPRSAGCPQLSRQMRTESDWHHPGSGLLQTVTSPAESQKPHVHKATGAWISRLNS